jgi:Uma2 family endonuclease
MSPSDKLNLLKQKMERWIENGVQLAWLIIPKTQQVFIYRKDGSIDTVNSFNEKLSGEEVLPDFILNLNDLLEV